MPKLVQETRVVLEEELDVVDAVLEHGEAVEAHAEGEAGDFAGVVADVVEDRRVNHASAAKLNPDRKSTRLNSSHIQKSRMPSSA